MGHPIVIAIAFHLTTLSPPLLVGHPVVIPPPLCIPWNAGESYPMLWHGCSNLHSTWVQITLEVDASLNFKQ